MSSRLRVALATALVLVGLCLPPVAARAELVLEPGSVSLQLLNAAGEAEDRAGAHPDRLVQEFRFAQTGGEAEAEYMKEVFFELPAGLSGDASAVPYCPRTEVNNPLGICPADSQVGIAEIGSTRNEAAEKSPIYNLEPGPNEVVSFVAVPFISPIYLSGELRPGDEGLTLRAGVFGNNGGFATTALRGPLILWGVPADHQQGTSIPRRALFTTPSRCEPPLAVSIRANTWQHPDRWLVGDGDTGHDLVGCGELPFSPQLDVSLDHPSADVPSGAQIEVTMPQSDDPGGRASSQMKDLSVSMPAGVTLSPGGAEGLQPCSDAQLRIGESAAAECPAASRVGTVEMSLPGVDKPLSGSIFLGQEHPGDRFRLFIVASAKGSQVKLVGSLTADSGTGQLTATIDDLPEAAFERLTLSFDDGPGALLATPLACGKAATDATFTPYSGGPPVTSSGSVEIAARGGGCPGPPPFAPGFSGGSTSARAGASTSFTATVRRQDGEQLPSQLSIAMPAGIGAALGAVSTCGEAQAAAASCPASSQVGSAEVELGPGGEPARLDGDAFLTGPYRGAPFGLALVFPARLGSFDLGTLVLRGAVEVDPRTGAVTVLMGSLPTIFEGIPIRFQTLGLDLDRSGFLRNPTSCAPTTVAARMTAAEGAVANVASPFQVRGCVDLPFRPRLSLALEGRRQLHRGGHPVLRMAMRLPGDDAGLRAVGVTLPAALRVDAGGVASLCSRPRARSGRCPAGSRVGTVAGISPLLQGPMRGSVYLVQPRGEGPPGLSAQLLGQGVRIDLRGSVRVDHGRAETSFTGLPDFPLEKLDIRLGGGEGGLLRLRSKPCGGLRADLALAGQNGARVATPAPLRVAACGGG